MTQLNTHLNDPDFAIDDPQNTVATLINIALYQQARTNHLESALKIIRESKTCPAVLAQVAIDAINYVQDSGVDELTTEAQKLGAHLDKQVALAKHSSMAEPSILVKQMKHIAELEQKLAGQQVIINLVRSICAGEAKPNWDNSWETTNTRGRILDITESGNTAVVCGDFSVSEILIAKIKEETIQVCASMVDHILKEGGGTYVDAIRSLSAPKP